MAELDHRRLTVMAILLNLPEEWPEDRIRRFLEPYFIPGQWYMYDRYIDYIDNDSYAVAERKWERLFAEIHEANKGRSKKSKIRIIYVFAFIMWYMYYTGFIKRFNEGAYQLRYNALVQPCVLTNKISSQQSKMLEKIHMTFLENTVNKIWEQTARELLFL